MSVMKNENRGFKKELKRFQKAAGAVLIAAQLMLLSILTPAAVSQAAEAVGNTTDFYQSVEKANLEKQIDDLTKFYGIYLENYKKSASGLGAEATIKAEFDPDFAAVLGLKNLKNIKTTAVTRQTDKKAESIITFFTNDIELTTMNILSDVEKEVTYLLIPELSKAYLNIPANAANSNSYSTAAPFTAKDVMDFFNNNPLTEKLLNQLLKRYAGAALGEIKNVSSMDYFMTAGGISDDQTMFTVKIDEKTLLSIAEKVLKIARTDDDLKDLLVKLKVCTEEQYGLALDAALKSIASQKELSGVSNNEILFVMRVWVDAQGNITGRDFLANADSKTSVFGYKTVKDGTYTGIEAWVSPDEEEVIKLSGAVSEENGLINGDLTFSITDAYTDAPLEFNLALQDYSVTTKDTTSYMNGKIVITGASLPGQRIEAALYGNEIEQKIKAELIQETTKLVTVTITSKVLPYEDFDLPTDSDKIYKMETQLEDYLKETNFTDYLENINKKVNVEGINAVIEQLLDSYKLN